MAHSDPDDRLADRPRLADLLVAADYILLCTVVSQPATVVVFDLETSCPRNALCGIDLSRDSCHGSVIVHVIWLTRPASCRRLIFLSGLELAFLLITFEFVRTELLPWLTA